jgi:hypothetical protein
MVRKVYAYHTRVISSDKLLDTLNEERVIERRTVSIQLGRPGATRWVIFEHEQDLG